ncbi:TonB-dependent receptor [Parabacteroides sp. GYB001]|uniref:TonB-dependent receptor plug domain-containing protein n=1 Tax=Parabacteroides leei TaxID=2939491 RepID=UPI0020171C4A|nr:TonB-dependent receptor plug domain-containing protein [Parabacteroides leei]MCL3852270.1 TonB-dependent receptor [Parabacteroides leei]
MKKYNQTKTWVLIFFVFCSLAANGQKNILSIDTLHNIRLREVVVTATQSDAPGTCSMIGQDAIRHIQATDLSDLSQLLPGVLTRNPDLNTPAVFTIRSATYENTTNALGTAILVDGMQMSNNMNMQQMGLEGQGSLFNSSVLSGFDVRSISPASIESIEVIRGVPSARYGDATSGVVLVNSKVGLQPYTVGLRFTATEKLASISKGIAVGTHGNILHLGADYAYSSQDPRLPEQAFQRVGVQIAHTKDFASASLRINLRGYWMQDKGGKGRNTIDGEYQKAFSRGLSFSANGQWNLNSSWITNLEYHAGLTFDYQKNESSTYYSGTQQITTYTRLPGEQGAFFLAPSYFSDLLVEGKPIYANASLTANLRNKLYNNVYNHFMLGVEVNTEGNRGKGIQFAPLRPPLEMIQIRTRSFRSIPFVYNYTAFAEDKITFRTGRMRTELQAGVRITQLQTEALQYAPTVDPRINLRQILVESKEDTKLKHLSIRAGWGLMHKMPVLAYLYPDKSYIDQNSFTYNDMENNERLAVVHTFVTDRTFNPELHLPVNRKFELGLNLRIGQMTADVVWFREHLRNGFCTTEQAEPFSYRRYDPLTGKGEHPELTSNGVINNGQLLPYTTHTTFATYTSPENGIDQLKQGIEYTLDMGRWNLLHTSFFISGSYLNLHEKNTALSAVHPQVELNGKPYPYVGIYEADHFATNLRIWQQFSTRFQFITQLPRIGLVTTLTLQAVWMDKQRRGMESNYNNSVYLIDDNGNRVDGDPMTDTKHRKRLNPVYYMDSEGVRHPFTPEMANDKRFADLVLEAGTPTVFLADSFGPYFLLNLRVTKKIGRYISVAFCANNFTQSNPKKYTNSTQQYTIKNPGLYYGAEMTIQF